MTNHDHDPHDYRECREQIDRLTIEVNNLRTDVDNLHHDKDRLLLALAVLRRCYADLVAAGRASLLADGEGEPDPLAYLRDELPAPPVGHPLVRPAKTRDPLWDNDSGFNWGDR